ncbi:hypothetical protein RJT34_20223 [Clitoria ternatea]|uniref:Uncharacterized protein n=1 Tax=Clitoria ternatea TaxID=43366 RepID=A0AAN9ISG1_CLITE
MVDGSFVVAGPVVGGHRKRRRKRGVEAERELERPIRGGGGGIVEVWWLEEVVGREEKKSKKMPRGNKRKSRKKWNFWNLVAIFQDGFACNGIKVARLEEFGACKHRTKRQRAVRFLCPF